MDISLGWIKDFIDIPEMSPEEYGRVFTLATAEVEGVKLIGKGFEHIKVAEVKEAKKHPEADKLSVCQVDIASGGLIEVVCGAPNVRAGLKVAYAPVGFTMPNGLKLESRKIRGIVSNGMLCSEAELEVGDDHSGIWELPVDAPVGKSLVDAFPFIQDVVIDIDNKSLTHRPDLWGHIGLAREWAAIQRKKLNYPFTTEWVEKWRTKCSAGNSPIKVKVEQGTASLGYFGLSVDNVKVEPSPLWMQQRLRVVGLRPINNIVDISNYVMLETGLPNHIFDREMIRGAQIIIRQANNGEKLEMLDDSVVELIDQDTVVADQEGALVVGGVMGGKFSGVSDKTNKIFIECANWVPAKIRRTSHRVGLRTDSSLRYEKSLDSNLLERTLLRILELVFEICPAAQVSGKIEYDGPQISSKEQSVITTSYSRICDLLGKQVANNEIKTILECLDFEVSENKDAITVTAPTYRSTKDIECEYCLVEEVGRMIGYDNVEPHSPFFKVNPVRLSNPKFYQRKIQDFLSLNMPAYEVITYALVGEKLLKKAGWPDLNQQLILGNPTSAENDRMRPALIPSLLSAAALNAKSYASYKAFEISRVYHADSAKEVVEPHHLGIISFARDKSGLLLDVINTLEGLGVYLGTAWQIKEWSAQENGVMPPNWKGWHPHQSAVIELNGKIIGGVTKVNPALLLTEYKLRGELVIAEIDLSAFDGCDLNQGHKYQQINRYPSSEFDCTVVADQRTPAGKIASLVRSEKIDQLTAIKIVTVFEMDDKKAVTLRAYFGAPDRTLSADEIKQGEEKVLECLKRAGFPLR